MLFHQKLINYLFKYRGHLVKAELLSAYKCQNKCCSSGYHFQYGREQLLRDSHSPVRIGHIILPISLELCHNHFIVNFLHTSYTHVRQYRAAKPKCAVAAADLNSRLSKIFNYNLDDVPELLKKYTFLSHMSLSLIKLKINIMEAYNLPLSFMKQNMRIFYHVSTAELVKRLNLLKDKGFLDDNPVLTIDKLGHYLECSNEVFHIAFQKLCSELESLEGCRSQVEYIQKRLQCSKEQAAILNSSYPLNRTVSNAKLKEFFDFVLIEAKLSPSVVEQNMRLCSFSMIRLRERMKIMEIAKIAKDKWPAMWYWPESKFIKQFDHVI